MQSRVQLINFLSTGMFISPVPLHAAALASLRLQHGGPAPTDPDGNPVNSLVTRLDVKKRGKRPSTLLYYQHFKVLKFKR